ncbi:MULTISPECIES: DUF1353 domain-containing protein [Nitrosomonas]|uniref:Uncharacterized protein DUF1353 n=1 Tax=Nitrosomonas communis TaxID=44574 RepID=A0A0F7KEQ3_9PROT|nr:MULTISPECIES: DUF1353 domain-containing protein [Nitrosomonas]AKH37966.1 hypothetical protein AAW31_09265 [Nitrosomonas communis]TYP77417.1 uncharacterized protein DUF1353 [Nitrosomonas communis]UVS59834.1 DUF1353 domain-containing protein [Nitrosomonas sp. PLL12]
MNNGSFSGKPRTLWLTESGDDRQMQILELFTYTDPDGKVWDAPEGVIINGASIPRPLWALVGSPYTGDYRRASIVHDVACDRAKSDRKLRRAADRMFYHACRAGGCSVAQSIIFYLGVRIGAIWPLVPQWRPALRLADSGARLSKSASEERMEADFRLAGEMILSQGEVDDADEIERRTDDALSKLTSMEVQKF